jgi:hypothetical protein
VLNSFFATAELNQKPKNAHTSSGANHNTQTRSYLMTNVSHTLQANPWVSLRRDQLIPANKVVNEEEQLEKGLEEEEKKCTYLVV